MLETTVHELYDRVALSHAGRVAVRDDHGTLTYAELGDLSRRFAAGLWSLGVRHGDRVVIWTENRSEYVVADLAISRLGAIRVPFNTYLSDEEATYRLAHTSPRVVLTSPRFSNRLADLATEEDRGRIQVVELPRRTEEDDAFSPLEGAIRWSDLIDRPPAQSALGVVGPSDIAAVMYTGGTTGRSKGVLHTHHSSLSLSFSAVQEWDIAPDEVMLHVAPLAHAGGFMIYSGLWRGASNVIAEKFDVDAFSQSVEQHGVTWSFLVPTMIYRLLDARSADQHDLSSLRTLLYGAAPMAPARVEEALSVFGPVLAQAYAQMEVLNQVTMLRKSDHVAALRETPERLASCGRPVTMANVRIADDDMTEVEPNEVGEIVVKSPHATRGYWCDPGQTEGLFRNGWLRTGDMAYRDDDGYVFIVDRAKDMVITGGLNVYSSTVENVVMRHEAVANVAMFGVPHEDWGEAVRIAVQLHPDRNASDSELLEHCRAHLSAYEVPKGIEFHEELPLTAYGKVDKKALREPHWRGEMRAVS